jgi:hypothetical protein
MLPDTYWSCPRKESNLQPARGATRYDESGSAVHSPNGYRDSSCPNLSNVVNTF